MMFSLCSFVSCAFANEIQDIEQAKKEAHVITYKVTIYHDQEDKYDKEQWQKTVEDVAQVIKKGQKGSADEMIAAFVRSLKVLTVENDTTGIHGEMKISMSDGVKDTKKCGEACPCITKYKGVCPCTVENNCSQKASQIRTTCSEQCQKTGCTPKICAQNGCVQSCNS